MKLSELLEMHKVASEEGIADNIADTTTQTPKVGDTPEDEKVKAVAKLMNAAGIDLEAEGIAKSKEERENAEEGENTDIAEEEALEEEAEKTAEEAEYFGRFMARGFWDEMEKIAEEENYGDIDFNALSNDEQVEVVGDIIENSSPRDLEKLAEEFEILTQLENMNQDELEKTANEMTEEDIAYIEKLASMKNAFKNLMRRLTPSGRQALKKSKRIAKIKKIIFGGSTPGKVLRASGAGAALGATAARKRK